MPGVHTLKKAHSYCIFKLHVKWILLTLAHLLRFRFKNKNTIFLQKAARRFFRIWLLESTESKFCQRYLTNFSPFFSYWSFCLPTRIQICRFAGYE